MLFLIDILFITLQPWAPVGGVGAKVDGRPPGKSPKHFHYIGAFLLLFSFYGGPFLGLPPPQRKSLRAPIFAVCLMDH